MRSNDGESARRALAGLTGDLSRRRVLRFGALIALSAAVVGELEACSSPDSSGGGKGTGVAQKPTEPFVPSQKVGMKPDLPRVVGWNEPAAIDFWDGFAKPMIQACHERDIEVLTTVANTDGSLMTQQVHTMLQKGIGALVIMGNFSTPAARPLQEQALQKGVAVFTELIGPSTNQVTDDQYAVGHALGAAAAKWVTSSLHGKAKVVYFNHDQIQPLVARHKGTLDGVKSAGDGVSIIADVTVPDETNSTGYKLMNTVLQAHPDVDIVLAESDSVAVGALAALQAAGKANGRTFVGGVNGDSDALAKVKSGGPYRCSIAFAFPLSGYATGQWAADYLDGKSIPSLSVLTPVVLDSAAAVDTFNQDMGPRLKDVFADYSGAMKKYLTNYGEISYETRGKYLTGDYT